MSKSDKSDELRFSLPADQYLERNHVMVYLEDAIAQLLEHKDDSTVKVNPFKFFSSYFASVKEGTHVLLREYSFVKATLHNRACLVRLFWRSFSNIARKTELMGMQDYHSLLCILCPDFPMSVVQKTARIVLVDDSLDCLMSFTDFLYAFQLQFCFEEFLSKCADVYQVMLQNRSSGMETVVVPTSQLRAPANASSGDNNNVTTGSVNDGVDSSLFQRTMAVIGDKMDIALPSDILKDVLSAAPRTTFYNFLTTLAKSSAVNQYIDKLPQRSELMTTFEPEMTSTISIPPELLQADSSSTSHLSLVLPSSENNNVISSKGKSSGNKQSISTRSYRGPNKIQTSSRSLNPNYRNHSHRLSNSVTDDENDDDDDYNDDFDDDDDYDDNV